MFIKKSASTENTENEFSSLFVLLGSYQDRAFSNPSGTEGGVIFVRGP